MHTEKPLLDCIISDGFGVYIPQMFTERFEQRNISDEDWQIAASGPDHEWYWEAWDTIQQDWEGPNGEMLWQDGDLFLIYKGTVWDHETHSWTREA
mgnify:CR=1 FL=1